jgi:subtilase family serine protease
MFSRRKNPHPARPIRQFRRARVAVEELEPRNLLSIFTPAQIRHAYGFDQVMFGSVKGDGSGQTIAIVDAFDDPRIASDLHVFDQTFGLRDPVFTKATPQGTPRTDSGWSLEISLDAEWAHAIAPGAKILLVEAKSASFSNLLGAVDYARNQPGVAAVSMSWGEDELFLNSTFETANDAYFTTPAGHSGITFVAASGDDGGLFGPGWPAISPNVLSVGGTSLFLDSSGNYSHESGWSGSSGGVSFFAPEPSYQAHAQNTGFRTNPDVSIVGDPNTGVYVYTTVSQSGSTGWFQVGGTSVGAPIWSALVAIADQGRALEGTTAVTKAALDGANDTLPALYQLYDSPTAYASAFHDVRTGSNSVASAGPGYDLVTGLGTPKVNNLIPDLLKVSAHSVQSSAVTTNNSSTNGGSAKKHVDVATPITQSQLQVDPTLAVALGNSAAPTLSVARLVSSVSGVSPAVTPVIIGPSTPTISTMASAPLQNAGAAETDDNGTAVVPADSNTDVVPPAPVKPDNESEIIVPVGPASQESLTPRLRIMDELYDAAGTDGRWTAAFADSNSLLTSGQIEEAGANDVMTTAAVALGGVWLASAGRPDQRKRLVLAP